MLTLGFMKLTLLKLTFILKKKAIFIPISSAPLKFLQETICKFLWSAVFVINF